MSFSLVLAVHSRKMKCREHGEGPDFGNQLGSSKCSINLTWDGVPIFSSPTKRKERLWISGLKGIVWSVLEVITHHKAR